MPLSNVRKIWHRQKKVLVLDYSDCSGDQMIERARSIVLQGNQRVVGLSIFNEKTFISNAFMRHAEKYLPEVDPLIKRQAIVGLSVVQEWILRGLNLWYSKHIHQFNTEEEALQFLTSDSVK